MFWICTLLKHSVPDIMMLYCVWGSSQPAHLPYLALPHWHFHSPAGKYTHWRPNQKTEKQMRQWERCANQQLPTWGIFLAPQKKTKGKGVGEKWEGKFGSLDFRTFDLWLLVLKVWRKLGTVAFRCLRLSSIPKLEFPGMRVPHGERSVSVCVFKVHIQHEWFLLK